MLTQQSGTLLNGTKQDIDMSTSIFNSFNVGDEYGDDKAW